MDNKQLAQSVLNIIGPENISDTYNCMTRLRLRVTSGAVRKDDLKKIPGVKGVIINGDEVQIVLGPGKAESVAKECKTLLAGKNISSAAGNPSAETGALNRREKDSPNAVSAGSGKTNSKNINPNLGSSTADRSKNFGDGKELHDKIKKKNSQSAFKRLLQRVGHIFIPLIPAFIGCGLLTGIVTLLLKINPELAASPLLQYLKLAGGSIFTVLNAFIGFYACKEFGGTPALGGAMAALLTAPGLADITLFGSPLVPGRGGVFASLLAGAVTALVETRIRKGIPDSFSLFLTPLITSFRLSGLLYRPFHSAGRRRHRFCHRRYLSARGHGRGASWPDAHPRGYACLHGYDHFTAHRRHGRLRTGRRFFCRIFEDQKPGTETNRLKFPSRRRHGDWGTVDLRCYPAFGQAFHRSLHRRRLRRRLAGLPGHRVLRSGYLRHPAGSCYK